MKIYAWVEWANKETKERGVQYVTAEGDSEVDAMLCACQIVGAVHGSPIGLTLEL